MKKTVINITREENGYSLIEMMIAIAILGLVLSGIYTSFDTGQKDYAARQAVIRMQQQGRLAITNLEKDLKMVGYGFADMGNLHIIGYKKPNTVTLDIIGGTSPNNKPDTIFFRYYDGSVNVLSDITLLSDYTTSDPSTDTPVNKVDGLNINDFYVVYDPTELGKPATLLRVTNINGTNLTHSDTNDYNPPAATELFPGSPKFATNGYKSGSKVLNLGSGKFKYVSYYVDANCNLVKETQDDPTGTVKTHVVATGIEDIQFQYQFKDGNWKDTPIKDDPDYDINNLRAIRVSVLVRSQSPDPKFNAASAYQLTDSSSNHPSFSGGGYRRMIISTVLYPRNLSFRN